MGGTIPGTAELRNRPDTPEPRPDDPDGLARRTVDPDGVPDEGLWADTAGPPPAP